MAHFKCPDCYEIVFDLILFPRLQAELADSSLCSHNALHLSFFNNSDDGFPALHSCYVPYAVLTLHMPSSISSLGQSVRKGNYHCHFSHEENWALGVLKTILLQGIFT